MNYRVKLREQINKAFSQSELRTLCFDLDVAYDSLPGQGTADKARELVAYFERRGQLQVLVSQCVQERPCLDWLDDRLVPSPLPLRQVQGIGVVFARRLFQAGIVTLDELAGMGVKGLAEALCVQESRALPILASARRATSQLDGRQQKRVLQKVRGIGPAFAARLYQAGIESLGQLASASPDEVARILRLRRNRAQAIVDAASNRIMACEKPGRTLPLQKVQGIGPVFAKRLCRAGIDTLEELVGLDEHGLADILYVQSGRAGTILARAWKSYVAAGG